MAGDWPHVRLCGALARPPWPPATHPRARWDGGSQGPPQAPGLGDEDVPSGRSSPPNTLALEEAQRGPTDTSIPSQVRGKPGAPGAPQTHSALGDGAPPLPGAWLWRSGGLVSGLNSAGLMLRPLGPVMYPAHIQVLVRMTDVTGLTPRLLGSLEAAHVEAPGTLPETQPVLRIHWHQETHPQLAQVFPKVPPPQNPLSWPAPWPTGMGPMRGHPSPIALRVTQPSRTGPAVTAGRYWSDLSATCSKQGSREERSLEPWGAHPQSKGCSDLQAIPQVQSKCRHCPWLVADPPSSFTA